MIQSCCAPGDIFYELYKLENIKKTTTTFVIMHYENQGQLHVLRYSCMQTHCINNDQECFFNITHAKLYMDS